MKRNYCILECVSVQHVQLYNQVKSTYVSKGNGNRIKNHRKPKNYLSHYQLKDNKNGTFLGKSELLGSTSKQYSNV